ncbi:MAG TPA: magnesium/cobalt transporter CorA [Segeticoccus sp.]|uniref:magnesium/cobalt transporter CorA n=1 Tax=Segeticoccus sp. TaxID=2706531 RepID=UPI002D80C115|nr:magnesium/cobalt transporter CorA [Segeticoccus sp.]HET8600615.1 magnesium/cobalt transporter CorA [Segeticoccus sp.]
MGPVIVDKAVYLDGQRLSCTDLGATMERLREEGHGFTWIGLKDPTDAEFARVNEDLRLHPLAVEDAVKGHQRPKVDFYPNGMFVVLKTLRYIEATSDVETGELMLFVGDRFVVTIRRGEANPLGGVRRLLESHPDQLEHGPVSVMYSVMDSVVDTYVTIDHELSDDLDDIEQRVFSGSRGVDATEIYRLKREVLEFRRASVPLLEPLQRLTEEAGLVPDPARPFFNDIYDHVQRVSEHAENYDRLLTDVLSAHLAQISVQQNEDMRKISAWVAIAAVPTMLAGIYGMNFDNIPELHFAINGVGWGYFAVLFVMASLCFSLYRAFKRSGWL